MLCSDILLLYVINDNVLMCLEYNEVFNYNIKRGNVMVDVNSNICVYLKFYIFFNVCLNILLVEIFLLYLIFVLVFIECEVCNLLVGFLLVFVFCKL